MRINTTQEKIITKGRVKKREEEYTLNDEGGQLFSIFSSSIYSNPHQAVVREVCTNMFDAHRDAGCPEKPFKIIFPTDFDSQIRFRDFGKGMSYDDVFRIFRVYGKSTKSDGSVDVGGFGIGSKSPFAYTSSFFVKSFQNGVVNIYENVMQENGKPKLSHVIEKETDEPDGMEISFSVNSEDVRTFEREVDYVLSFFPVMPDVVNYSPSLVIDMGSLEKLSDRVFKITRGDTYRLPSANAYVRMGCVLYPIRDNEEAQKIIKESFLYKIDPSTPFLIDMDIDEAEVRPTREDLLYTETTLNSIKKYFNRASGGLRQVILKHFKNMRNMNVKDAYSYVVGIDDYDVRDYIDNKFRYKLERYDGSVVFAKRSDISTYKFGMLKEEFRDMVVKTKPSDFWENRKDQLNCESIEEARDNFSIDIGQFFRAVPLDSNSNSLSVNFAGRFNTSKEFSLSGEKIENVTFYYNKRGCQAKIKRCPIHHHDAPDAFCGHVFIFDNSKEYADILEKLFKFYYGVGFLSLPTIPNSGAGNTTSMVMHYSNMGGYGWLENSTYRGDKFDSVDQLFKSACRVEATTFDKRGNNRKVLYQPMLHSKPVLTVLPEKFLSHRVSDVDAKMPNGLGNTEIILAQKRLRKKLKLDNRFQTYESALIGRLLSLDIEELDVTDSICLDRPEMIAMFMCDSDLYKRFLSDIGVTFEYDHAKRDVFKRKYRFYETTLGILNDIVYCFSTQWDNKYKQLDRSLIKKLSDKQKELKTFINQIEQRKLELEIKLDKRGEHIMKKYPLLRLFDSYAFTKYSDEIKKYLSR